MDQQTYVPEDERLLTNQGRQYNLSNESFKGSRSSLLGGVLMEETKEYVLTMRTEVPFNHEQETEGTRQTPLCKSDSKHELETLVRRLQYRFGGGVGEVQIIPAS